MILESKFLEMQMIQVEKTGLALFGVLTIGCRSVALGDDNVFRNTSYCCSFVRSVTPREERKTARAVSLLSHHIVLTFYRQEDDDDVTRTFRYIFRLFCRMFASFQTCTK
jgi:hypothetical protein